MSTGWFGRRGIAQLATAQKNSVQGISAVTQTCLAAYKQFDDIEFLLGELQHLDDGTRDPQQLDKIRERHEKYRVAMDNEVINHG